MPLALGLELEYLILHGRLDASHPFIEIALIEMGFYASKSGTPLLLSNL